MSGPRSNVLLLIICSNTKSREGEAAYAASKGVTYHLSQDSQRLLACREKIRSLLTGDALSREGTPMSELPYNKGLKKGRDFDPKSRNVEGRYLPAAQRYRGRFYEKLGPEGASALINSRHHVLIVSGLYGLLRPSELIQCYSCNVTDRSEVAKWWTADDLLTRSLVAYMVKHHITQVFDLMAVDAYRNLINWELLSSKTSAKVLHGFSNQLAGAALLFPFGELAKRFLETPENDLARLQPGDYERLPTYGVEVVFGAAPRPQSSNIRRERERAVVPVRGMLTPEDMVVRMRLNLGLVVDKLSAERGQDDNFPLRVNGLKDMGRIEQTAAESIKRINAVRNLVLHEYYRIPPDEWQEIQDRYWAIDAWAQQQPNLKALDLRPIKS